jgi:hypothetical protein
MLQSGSSSSELFTSEHVAHLPLLVQRYFLHSIAPGTPLAPTVELQMNGTLKLNESWRPFRARQILSAGQGFIWQPRITVGPLAVSGADICYAGKGQMRFDVMGLIPLVNATGSSIDRSALGRLAIEAIWAPAGLLPQYGVTWVALSDTRIQASCTLYGEPVSLTMTLAPHGRVQTVVMQRWSSDHDAYIPFGATVEQEQTFNGYTIPTSLRVSWWFDTDRGAEGEFFRCTVTDARFYERAMQPHQ